MSQNLVIEALPRKEVLVSASNLVSIYFLPRCYQFIGLFSHNGGD